MMEDSPTEFSAPAQAGSGPIGPPRATYSLPWQSECLYVPASIASAMNLREVEAVLNMIYGDGHMVEDADLNSALDKLNRACVALGGVDRG